MISRFNKFVQPDLSWVEHNDIKSYDFSPMANELKKYYTDFANLNAASQLQFKYLTPNQVAGTKVDATADLEAAKAIDSSLKTIKNKAVEAFQKKDWTAYAEATKSLRSVIPQVMQDASALQSRYKSFNEQKEAFQKDSKNLNSKFYWKNLQGSKFKDENGNYGGIGTYSPTDYIDRYKKTQEIFEKLGIKDISYSKVRGEWIDNITQKAVPLEYVRQAEEQLRSNPEYQTQLRIDVLSNFDPDSYKQSINSEKEALKKVIDIAVKDGDKKTIRRIQGMLGVQTDGNFGKNSKEALNNYLAQEPDNLEAHAISKQFQRDIGYGKSLLDNTYSHGLAANPNHKDELYWLSVKKLSQEIEKKSLPEKLPESSAQVVINNGERLEKLTTLETNSKKQINEVFRSNTFLPNLKKWFGTNTELNINSGVVTKAFSIIANSQDPKTALNNLKASGLNFDPKATEEMFNFARSGNMNNAFINLINNNQQIKVEKDNLYNSLGEKIIPEVNTKFWSQKTQIPQSKIDEWVKKGNREELGKLKYTESRGKTQRGEQQETYRFIDTYDKAWQKVKTSEDLVKEVQIRTIPIDKLASDKTLAPDILTNFANTQVKQKDGKKISYVSALENPSVSLSKNGQFAIIQGKIKNDGKVENYIAVVDISDSPGIKERVSNTVNNNKSEVESVLPNANYIHLDPFLDNNEDELGNHYTQRNVKIGGKDDTVLLRDTNHFGTDVNPIIPGYDKDNSSFIGWFMKTDTGYHLLDYDKNLKQ